MAEKGSEPMPVPTVHLLITLRGPVWRVRILIPGEPRPRWRAYRAAEYPTPEAVARRCASGLAKCNPEDKAHECKKAASTIASVIPCFTSSDSMGVLRPRFDNSALGHDNCHWSAGKVATPPAGSRNARTANGRHRRNVMENAAHYLSHTELVSLASTVGCRFARVARQ